MSTEQRNPKSKSAKVLCAQRCRLVITDIDGVWTDGGVYYSGRGEEMKRFSVRDGMGVERLRNAGIETAIMTGERSESVAKRAEKLRIEALHLGIKDKKSLLATVCERRQLSLREVAYIGDDINDLPAILAVSEEGLTGAPLDAISEVQSAVDFISNEPGGHGAFRGFAEWLLKLRQEN